MCALPFVTDPSFEEADAIQRYWNDHYQELLANYPDEFVAMRDGKIIASHPDLAMLVYDLRDCGLDIRTDVAVQFISSKSASLIL